MSRPRPADRAAALATVYAKIPTIDCRGLCHDSCGPIQMTRTEHDRIQRRHGVDIPNRTIRDGGVTCEALTILNRCGAYQDRPVLCRLWGVLDTMPCTHGCTPARYLTGAEGYRLLADAYDIDGNAAAARRFRAAADALDADPERTRAISPVMRAFTAGKISVQQVDAAVRRIDQERAEGTHR